MEAKSPCLETPDKEHRQVVQHQHENVVPSVGGTEDEASSEADDKVEEEEDDSRGEDASEERDEDEMSSLSLFSSLFSSSQHVEADHREEA